jgi:uncharacterized protein YozE (UPF0346 family)
MYSEAVLANSFRFLLTKREQVIKDISTTTVGSIAHNQSIPKTMTTFKGIACNKKNQ